MSISTKNSMEEVSVEELIQKYNLIVPEIQREYVWGSNPEKILDQFIIDIKSGYQANSVKKEAINNELAVLQKIYDQADQAAQSTLSSLMANLTPTLDSVNIGFLYSYRPDYYVFNDVSEDLYLIDGQQRFTTLFLLLFYLSIKEKRKEDFQSIFRFESTKEHIAFDYRVRTLTHNFFVDLLMNTQNLEDLNEIRNKNWFLSNYKDDVTIQSIVGKKTTKFNTEGIFSLFDKYFLNEDGQFFDFVKKQIKFWHFKTEETSQGEELYITMNSRGQQLADNENLRARLFEPEEIVKTGKSQRYWAEEWEKWQDFFWKHRDKSDKLSNADVGFNEFLRWIQIIKMAEMQEISVDDENEDAPDKKAIIEVIRWDSKRRLNYVLLSLPEIENYFKALSYLFTEFKSELVEVKSNYCEYSNFDLIDENWLHPEQGYNEQVECFKIIPILAYCKNMLVGSVEINKLSLFRMIRYFFSISRNSNVKKAIGVQLINAIRLVSSLNLEEDIISFLLNDGVSATLLNAEERRKLKIYSEPNLSRTQAEDLFWNAEDINYNDGNIDHLINLTNEIASQSNSETHINLEIFKRVSSAYEELIHGKDEIFGDLLSTNVYTGQQDRIFFKKEWYKENDFLNFARDRYHYSTLPLDDFLIKKRREFLQQYGSVIELKGESMPKKQLYLYYIIYKTVLKKDINWAWGDGWHFGIYDKYTGHKSLFDTPKIFQHYGVHFREKEARILWFQKNIKTGNHLEELLEWSKN